ncbi:MAG: cytochrome c biogenesis protein CcsA [Chloroherpetonaceae bacterium]
MSSESVFFEFITGKFVTIVGFTAALCATYAFFRAAQSDDKPQLYDEWLLLARKSFFVMVGAIVINGLHLLYLILTHQFKYNYVKHYSSTDLNIFYLISTFYAGQEGSFMLWMFYGCLFGFFLMKTAKEYEAPVMTVLSLSQAFLLSMILGIEVPFLKDGLGSDVFALTLGPVPQEGDGLNPLLQNPWMVIHPPTLFVGFSSLIIPFSYAIAAMWKNKYDDWVRPAMPWVLFSAATLGIGIMMGGYWAYKVLGWGGYWGWDPVENSSLVPWLLIVSLLHTMIVQKKNGALKKTNLMLAVLAFSTVLYSSFLTRSGVLADTSVHSFTDLGLYNQLLAFTLTFLGLGVVLLLVRFKSIKVVSREESLYSREFFLLCGAVVLMLIAGVVVAGISTPIVDSMLNRQITKLEPDFYNQVTLPLAVLIGLLSAIGQSIWWTKIDKENLVKALWLPFTLALVFTTILMVGGVKDVAMILLALTASFSLFANGQVLLKVLKGNPKYVGGSLTHVGLGLMLLGIIGSAKYDESQHVELPKGKTIQAFGKQMTYTGMQDVGDGKSGFKIQVVDGSKSYIAMPVMYETKRMTVQNPDVAHYLTKDFYIAPVNLMVKENPNQLILKKGESQMLEGYAVKFVNFNMEKSILGGGVDGKIKVVAMLEITKDGKSEMIEPVYNVEAGSEPKIEYASIASNPSVSFAITRIDASSGRVMVEAKGLGADVKPQETLIIEASIKPYINVLWLGTYIVAFGFVISIYRRWQERKLKSRPKSAELVEV